MSLVFGFVKFFKSISINVPYGNDIRVYLHLLLNAGYKESNYKGVDLSEGQLVTSYPSIGDSLGLSRKQVMTAVEHLEANNMIEWVGVKQHYSICTICDYALQSNDKAYNFVKLYRSIQGAEWYRDSAAANLYYYILLNSKVEGLRVKRGVIINALKLTPHAFSCALANLADTGAIQYSKEGVYYIIHSYADLDKEDKPKTTTTSSKSSHSVHSNPSTVDEDEAVRNFREIFG